MPRLRQGAVESSPKNFEFPARTLKAEAFVSQSPDQCLEVQESPDPVGLIHVTASQANERGLGIFGPELHTRTKRIGKPLVFVLIPEHNKAPPSPARSTCNTVFNGQSIQIFRTVERIVRSCVRRSDLLGYAEKSLKDKKTKKSLGASELRRKWYYLRWAIKTVLDADPRVSTRNLPFAITREYWKRTNRPSNVDALFEEEERIVI